MDYRPDILIGRGRGGSWTEKQQLLKLPLNDFSHFEEGYCQHTSIFPLNTSQTNEGFWTVHSCRLLMLCTSNSEAFILSQADLQFI